MERAVVVVDEAATAELVYVAMTRGRRENRACLVTELGDEGDHERRWRRPPTPGEALAEVLGRSGAERSATEVLRTELEHCEDLALLMPALVEAQRFIDERAGPDRGDELDRRLNEMSAGDSVVRAAARRLAGLETVLQQARAAVEAGRLEVDSLAGRGGLFRRRLHAQALRQARYELGANMVWLGGAEHEAKQARLSLDAAMSHQTEVAERFTEVTAAVRYRDDWMASHPIEVNYHADLAERADSRRHELALVAEDSPAPHIVRLLGHPPLYGADREHWLAGAGALESYREQWRVEPDDLGHETNLRGAQALEWEGVRAELEPGPAELEWQPPRWSRPGLERGRGIDF